MRLRSFDVLIWLLGVALYVLGSSPVADASQWATISLPSRAVNIAENHGVLWVCGTDELVANSSDGGKTWKVVHSLAGGGVLLSIGLANEQFIYAAGTTGVIVSKDGGATWSRLTVPANVVYRAAFGDAQHGLIHTPHAVYLTSDGGLSWSPVSLNFSDEQGAYSFVLALAASDSNHMMIVLSVGNAPYFSCKFVVTSDAGTTWKPTSIPNVNFGSLAIRDSEYWLTGSEVIEKDKPGGGYGVALAIYSKDGETWTHVPRWSQKEFSSCNADGCLYWDGGGVAFSHEGIPIYWKFPAEKAVTAKWAVANDGICSVGAELKCAGITTSSSLPGYDATSSPIPVDTAPPRLDAPPSQGLQCLLCSFETVIVTQDYKGIAEVDLTLHIGVNGVVTDASVNSAPRPEIGERLAAAARGWIFLPYEKDGTVHPVVTHFKIRVQAVKSK